MKLTKLLHKKSITKKGFLAGIGLVSVCLMTSVLSSCSNSDFVYKIPEADLPTSDTYALNQYSYDELGNVFTTVHADTMKVLERNVQRPDVEILSDDFSLVFDKSNNSLYTKYGQLIESTDVLKTATITFNQYPSPSAGCSGENAFTNGKMNGEAVDPTNSKYYKYMLMSQIMHLSKEASYLSARGELTQSWLKKHPAADAQYGAVKGENNAVIKEIILDPLYRSYHTTGLYLPAGELISVKVEGLKPGEKVSLFMGVQDSMAWAGGADTATYNSLVDNKPVTAITAHDFFTKGDVLVANNRLDMVSNQGQWTRQNNRAPWLHADFTLSENKEYKVGTSMGGAINVMMNNCYSKVKLTISGAVEAPHYILGTTTPEYFDTYLRNAPGVIATLDTENGQLIGPTGEMDTTNYMRSVKTDEIDKLAMLWHSFLSVNESFTGGTYNRFNKIMFDWHVPAGDAVALGNYSFAQLTGWFKDAMNYRRLLSHGTWGTLHEIGHNHSSAYGTVWGFGDGKEGEVRNNALTLLSYIMFCDVGTTVRSGTTPEHGEYANPYRVLTETISKKGKYTDFSNGSYFEILGMYANIMHSFGANKYYELLYTYKDSSSYIAVNSDDDNSVKTKKKRADFAYRCSLVYKMNFLKYFNDFYSAGITEDLFSEEQLNSMKTLPNYEPVSSFYAGGIDGVKTAGDYAVAFGENIDFDLLTNTISTLDTTEEKGFKITKVHQPEHGKIKKKADGVWTYSFNKNYTGTFDEFSFDVRLNDGTIHTLTVTLRISYNGSRVTAYNDVVGNNFDEVKAFVDTVEPSFVVGSASAEIKKYNTTSGKKDVRISEYYWKAPVTGEISLSAKWDDWAEVYIGESFKSLGDPILVGTHDISSFKEYGVRYTVEKDKYYAVKVFNVNTGGGGSAAFAYKTDEDESYHIPALTDIYHPDFPLGKEVEQFVFEPEYLISKKDNIKLSVTGTDKSEWSIVQAPENIHEGRFYTEQQVDNTTGLPIEGSEVTIDKWSWLIDGQEGTILHTSYKDNPPQITPTNAQVFIVDTSRVQTFNFFKVITRNTANAYITDCELQISNSLDDNSWKTIKTATKDDYVKNSLTMKFDDIEGRYLKFIIKGTTGGAFSVICEFDAGVESSTQQVIPPSTSKFFKTSGWKNSSDMVDEEIPNGYLVSDKKNQKLVVKFVGEGISFYAATGQGYGKAKVYIDGKYISTIDLNSSVEEARKLVFSKSHLSNKEHTMEIITTSSSRVMLNAFGIPYTANLINASNIYKEKALTIALVIFILLTVALIALVALLVFLPKFREKAFGNKYIKKLDEREKKAKPEKEKKADGEQHSKEKKKTEKQEKQTVTPSKKSEIKAETKASTNKASAKEEKTATKTESKAKTTKAEEEKKSKTATKSTKK